MTRYHTISTVAVISVLFVIMTQVRNISNQLQSEADTLQTQLQTEQDELKRTNYLFNRYLYSTKLSKDADKIGMTPLPMDEENEEHKSGKSLFN